LLPKKPSFVSRIQCSISATHNLTHLQQQRKRHNPSCFYTTDDAGADWLKNTWPNSALQLACGQVFTTRYF